MKFQINGTYLRKNETIKGFECYMFSTMKKFFNKHTKFEGGLYIVDGRYTIIKEYDITNRNVRSQATREYNILNKEIFGEDWDNTDNYSSALIYLINEEENGDITNYDEEYDALSLFLNAFIDFLEETQRVGAIISHFHQGDNCPHLHFLYSYQDDAFIYFLKKYLAK